MVETGKIDRKFREFTCILPLKNIYHFLNTLLDVILFIPNLTALYLVRSFFRVSFAQTMMT